MLFVLDAVDHPVKTAIHGILVGYPAIQVDGRLLQLRRMY